MGQSDFQENKDLDSVEEARIAYVTAEDLDGHGGILRLKQMRLTPEIP